MASENTNRPKFPARAVVTAGMPYGNKDLHFGHIGGVFVPADFFARFLRDRIGAENVLFVSGTDCYGSPIMEGYRKLSEAGEFSGTWSQPSPSTPRSLTRGFAACTRWVPSRSAPRCSSMTPRRRPS